MYGGFAFAWNGALNFGLIEYLIATCIVAPAYLFIALSSAEMVSMFRFSGGDYGFARAVIGPFVGYIVGCCELYRGLVYAMIRLYSFGKLVTAATGNGIPGKAPLEPLYWILVIIPMLAILCAGSKPFWLFITCTGLYSLLSIVLYLSSAASYMNFDQYAFNGSYGHDPFPSSVSELFMLFPTAAAPYLAMTVLPLLSEEVADVSLSTYFYHDNLLHTHIIIIAVF